MKSAIASFSVMCFVFMMFAVPVIAQESGSAKKEESTEIELADGNFKMMAPGAWKMVEPKSTMIEVEYKIPMADGDDAEKDGRLTIMAAGGSIDANIERWKGQFSQPDGSRTSEKTKVEEIDVNGMKAHMVDITGTYADRPRMTAPPTMRDNYRMLAAIVETGDRQYFVKFYGGTATVEANKKRFDEFIKSFAKAGD